MQGLSSGLTVGTRAIIGAFTEALVNRFIRRNDMNKKTMIAVEEDADIVYEITMDNGFSFLKIDAISVKEAVLMKRQLDSDFDSRAKITCNGIDLTYNLLSMASKRGW